MSARVRLASLLAVIALVLAAVAAPGVWAQGGTITPQHSDAAWQAWYWNNTTFSGSPALQRSESEINYDWGSGPPGGGVNADQFSARWTRYFDVAPGLYRFTATSDDGVRVWVDNQLLINQWNDHAPLTFAADANLGSGHHLVIVEFYENQGGAVARFSLAPVTPTITTWRGEYYNNMGLEGAPSLVRDDPSIDFNFGTGSPAPGVIGNDYFSIRWTRGVNLDAGNYRFTVTTDDGTRLWINDHLLIDTWQVQAPHTYTGDIYLPGGPVSIKMEYYENNGGAVARMSWARLGVVVPPPPPPPAGGDVVVEDGGVGYSFGGSPTAWHYAYEGSGGRLAYTGNNDWARPNYNWARWYPQLTAQGRYEVYVYIPVGYGTTAAANYWISHSGGYTLRVVSQAANAGRWVSLGTYTFRGNSSDYVSLADVTGERYVSKLVAFDAVKFSPR